MWQRNQLVTLLCLHPNMNVVRVDFDSEYCEQSLIPKLKCCNVLHVIIVIELRKPRRLMRNSKFGIRNSGFKIRDRTSLANQVYARALLKQKMADAADKTIRVCSSSGVVFAFIVGPEGNFLIEELGK